MALPTAIGALFVLLTVCVGVSGVEVVDDASCLLQNSVKVTKRHDHTGLPYMDCPCLNFKQVYNTSNELSVDCGRGAEMAALHRGHFESKLYGLLHKQMADNGKFSVMIPQIFADFCANSFKMMDDNRCARTAHEREAGKWYSQNWCYVSSECADPDKLGSGGPWDPDKLQLVTGTKVHVKICESGKDTMLGDLSPPELMAYGQRMNMTNPGLLVKMAYPTERKWFFKDVAEHQSELKEIADSNIITVIDTTDSGPNMFSDITAPAAKMIVQGKSRWLLSNGGKSYEAFACVSDNGCQVA